MSHWSATLICNRFHIRTPPYPQRSPLGLGIGQVLRYPEGETVTREGLRGRCAAMVQFYSRVIVALSVVWCAANGQVSQCHPLDSLGISLDSATLGMAIYPCSGRGFRAIDPTWIFLSNTLTM